RSSLPMTEGSAKLVLRGAHDQMRHEPQRAIEISCRKREVVGAELALEQINQDPPDLGVDRHPQEAHEQVIDRVTGSLGAGAKHQGGKIDPPAGAGDRVPRGQASPPPARAAIAGVKISRAGDKIRIRLLAARHASHTAYAAAFSWSILTGSDRDLHAGADPVV